MRRLLTFLLAAMAFAACTQNEVEELTANRADVPETLTVGFEGGDTRVELNEALKTVWTEGDEVSVYFYSDANQKWQYQGETGERLGTLRRVDASVATTQTDYVVVAYPYNTSYTLNRINANLIASLPAVQSYKDGSYGAEGNIMVAQSEFTQFSLKSVCGWLRVELTGEGEVVESVKVRGNNGEQVAGLIYVDTATAEATLAAEMGEASDEEEVGGIGGGLEFDDTVFTEVTLDCGDGVTLGSEATAFYIALLPQTFEKGMTIEINYANGNSQPLVCENSITISRNHISPIGIEANEDTDIPTNQLWYTATALVEPYDTSAFNVAIISNEWNEATGEGVITFDGELTTIGEYAFRDCTSLTSVTIPDSVTTIGYEAFRVCTSLTGVTIPDSVTTIGNYAFSKCSSLTSVTIPDSVTTIGYGVFADCSNLTSVTIGNSVTTIGGYAFCNCYSLTSVTIPDSVTTIGNFAFSGCSSLAEFKGKFAADDGRCLIKDNAIIAYAEASGTTYTIPDSVTAIGEGAFEYCNSLTSVTIPDSVTMIGDWAFGDCSSLESVTIGDSVTTIGDYAFYGCDSLTSVVIPNSVTTIGEAAFFSCDSLTSVTILDSVTTIGDWAFCYCTSLTSVYCKAIIPPHIDGAVFNNNSTDRKIYVHEECVDAYKTAWSEYADSIVAGGNIPESVTTTILYTTSDGAVIDASKFPVKSHTYNNGIGELILYGELTTIPHEMFRNYDTLTTIIIPDSVMTTGYGAFAECDNLTSVTIPESITSIGGNAFYDCTSLTSVTIPDSVTTIGDSAFWGCSSLTSVTIPDSVTTIGDYAFRDCDSLTSVVIPDSVTTIGYGAFGHCSSLTSVTIGDSVTTIGDGVFSWCSNLAEFKGKFAADGGRCLIKDNAIIAYANASGTTYTIPDSVTTIGDSAFSGCHSLTSVTIGDSVTTIGDYAFRDCYSLTSVTIPDSVTTIGYGAFGHCSGLTSVTIPDSVTTIGYAAFENCDNLTSVTIPDSVTTIGWYAFGGCSSLTSVTIGDSVTTIGERAFADCSNLAEFKGKFAADGGRCLIKDNIIIAYAEASGATYTIPDSVTTIGERAFSSCRSLESVTIGDSVTTIGDYAFSDCDSLTSVVIPDSVTTIGDGAFVYCSKLSSVYCEATTPPTLGDDNVFWGYDNNWNYVMLDCDIYVPAESVEAYKAAENWSDYAAKIVGYNFETGEVSE